MPSMNLASKSWNQPHITSVSNGRLHATTSVYSTWIILANTAYQARVSGIAVFQTESFTPGGHSLLTVNCLWIAWGLSSSVDDKSVGDRLTDLRPQ